MRFMLHHFFILVGAVLGALLGFPLVNFIKPVVSDILLFLIQFLIVISGIFSDEVGLAPFLFKIFDFLFESESSLPPVIFYIILIPYEIFWTYFYIKLLRKRDSL
jgi:hypothetical protein